MFVDESTSGKYKRVLLRDSYRENGKVKHNTIANISSCSPEEIQAIRLALKHKGKLADLIQNTPDISLKQGPSIGAVWLLFDIARQLGIAKALGNSREAKLALWQVMARVIDQGSRLSAVRLAANSAACDILALESFDEDDLYANLDWLQENQAQIETRLFKQLHAQQQPNLYLYDVTSSYLEGQCNELGAFGYNRDKKKGKKQIVIGLLCDEVGKPLSIEVFPGNTQDPKTVASQIRKVAQRFGGQEVTFVGDRGMLKSKQVEDLLGEGFHYITAITKPQIESLLKKGILEMGLFDQELAEVQLSQNVRYVLRRNPLRAEELHATRKSKLQALQREQAKLNEYLSTHPKAKVEVALRKLNARNAKLKLSAWVKVSSSQRKLLVEEDEVALTEVTKLDGCYVLKTDLESEQADKETVHARYKDLAQVEWAFRTSKTVELEMRPIHVRLETRTRGHAFVVMLAYRIVQELALRWAAIDATVPEGIRELQELCAMEMCVGGKASCHQIPEPRARTQELLDAANVRLPEVLPSSGVQVATRKKLPKNRKRV